MKPALPFLLLFAGAAFTAGNVDEERVLAESAGGENWFLKGGNFNGEHFSPLSDIHRGNVGRLGLAWSSTLPIPDGISATPIVIDGVIYISGAWSVVYAIDAATGEVLWQFDPDVRASLGDDPWMSWTARVNRGVAVWQGKVLITTADCRLLALDAATGREVWSQLTCDTALGYAITDSPYVGGDLVFVGNAGSESGEKNRGYVSAYHVASGELEWRFYTVPSADPKQNTSAAMKMAAATWSGDALETFGGGGSNWNEMTYDPDTGLLFFGTAGALPYTWHTRSPDGGDNLFLSSVVAVDAKTGEYAWHYQTVPQDSWEFNATMNIVLAEHNIDGRKRKTLLIAPKNGFHYQLDRVTGELLSAEKFAKVNWATHINLETGRPVYDDAASFWERPDERVEVWPNMWGAHSWNPMAYHPGLDLVYIPVVDVPTVVTGYEDGDYNDTLEIRRVIDGKAFDPGKLVAIEPGSGDIRWSVGHRMPYNGGVMVTAGDLVFQGDAYGHLNAYDAHDGALLWHAETGSRITAAPASYAVDGDQFVVVPVGAGGGLQFVYPDLHSDNDVLGPTRLMAFALDARENLPGPVVDARRLPEQPKLTADTETVEKGKALFSEHCSGCHGRDAATRYGGTVADLRYSTAQTHAQWPAIVLGGSRKSLGMPGFYGRLDASGAEAIRSYVLSLSEALRETAATGDP